MKLAFSAEEEELVRNNAAAQTAAITIATRTMMDGAAFIVGSETRREEMRSGEACGCTSVRGEFMAMVLDGAHPLASIGHGYLAFVF